MIKITAFMDDYMADDTQHKEGWHLDKRVPLALIFAIVVQTAGMVAWFTTLGNRVTAVEAWQEKNDATRDRLTAIETQLSGMKDSLVRIERKLDK